MYYFQNISTKQIDRIAKERVLVAPAVKFYNRFPNNENVCLF